tara:strand:+ start:2806 stop:3075 length:270 start_codon:yes stop_codon:yes gene_type:complete
MAIDKASRLKRILEAGALATDALSKGSAGGLGKALVESKIDLSGKNPSGKGGASKNAKDIKPFDAFNTNDAAGQQVTWKKMVDSNYLDK